ncbi:hypothetical protein GCM10009021_08870 [Halarchaeum nitratireducens]|uniref:Uncharacterized protein n=1 Tax=Halarchaeum nitratireducens TaxID=489913 RepID=A0A830G8Y3_9EURY|nr:hypothetical protein GCM10009021_08870 [Halarchaeum nitratireducens]
MVVVFREQTGDVLTDRAVRTRDEYVHTDPWVRAAQERCARRGAERAGGIRPRLAGRKERRTGESRTRAEPSVSESAFTRASRRSALVCSSDAEASDYSVSWTTLPLREM